MAQQTSLASGKSSALVCPASPYQRSLVDITGIVQLFDGDVTIQSLLEQAFQSPLGVSIYFA
ncbi:hypothetical protein MUBE_02040 [Mycobacterium uberis]|uniref:Uncharacterized protein n=1 Tax=Mycobacterium uberis TaxID=2162698 RepID=A0A3E1HLG5_9MYCO|nr:hypothetical protein [Mycobacterium uberis]RFD27362.1 hypothetical protein MUBE_02040 [Mycobacterium uberis]